MIGRWTTTLASLTLAATVGLTGCAAIRNSQASDREQFLAAAGFRMVLADTAERRQQLAAMPPHRLTRERQLAQEEIWTYENPWTWGGAWW